MSSAKARLEWHFGRRVARVILAAPKANIIDRAMIETLTTIFDTLESRRDLCAIVLTSDGPHFSFGASVDEHRPELIGEALPRLSNLLRRVAAAPAPTIAAIRGQCLGGGFELVLACDLIIAEQTAQFGVPEIRLGVFPPAASALLPVRLGTALASQLTLTGRTWCGTEGKQHGLVARVVSDGSIDTETHAWLESEFVLRSPVALRHAARAIRRPVLRALQQELPQIDRLYIDELMREPDAAEGIHAFLEKREPRYGGQAILPVEPGLNK